ncbi:MAG: hypothetical protein C4524_05725 [Candidatus Zixiibacteriota bacterium]|nr:MAG: hypothetical protein C4524_05725 [candidate division Zixibacteria bacterium]
MLEWPASGAKAMPGLYSLGFALAGSAVTLVDADSTAVRHWRDLGLEHRLELLDSRQVGEEVERGRRWDLCWNFLVLPTAPDPAAEIRRMAAAAPWLMVVHVNRFNVGFGVHRSVHRWYNLPWTHGELPFFSPYATVDFLEKNGGTEAFWGVVDCPPWPDSLGFRDVRLHRRGNTVEQWHSPYVKALQEGNLPGWLSAVYALERLPLPKALKLPYAHLFYACCRMTHD